ncbi:GHKL domain-containing protein [Aliivibrio fischeri]|uniref:sensor histidine kinase n=1 Tax=Aliivibrio fischeri TaxID=668 RepID=UPI0012D9BED7|nr:sensor histidine kinase [Aliivibrio fischeri]MUK30468.1 GHKL domain-containing protein [Aliivibrio fischeri]
MKRLVQNQFRRRILFSFLAVVIGFLILNGYLRYTQKKELLIQESTITLFRDVPGIINEVMSSGLIPPITLNSNVYNSNAKEVATVICDTKHTVLWHSFNNGLPKNIPNLCEQFPTLINTPILETKSSGLSFLYYKTFFKADDLGPKRFLIIIQKMDKQIESLQHLKLQLILSYSIIILIAIFGVLWGYKRSFFPLNKLHIELKSIKDSEQEKLIYSYPEELEPIAKTINRLLEQQDEQSNKYKKAMDDLAHSLKTRIATCDALLYQKKPPIADIMEQLNDMDSVIQHQLKRALMGSRGISKHHTLLSPIVDKLTRMFTKIHKDRHIEFIPNYNNTQTLPINYNDLMEVLGNILENSYRFADTYIILSIVERSEGFNIHIENDGEPLPQDKIESVFQRGIRADEKNPGTGIGLAVCEEIISSYNGQIWFHTQDTGSRLEIFLPHQI